MKEEKKSFKSSRVREIPEPAKLRFRGQPEALKTKKYPLACRAVNYFDVDEFTLGGWS